MKKVTAFNEWADIDADIKRAIRLTGMGGPVSFYVQGR
ncbi:hypothetical protein CNE_1c00340 [Cupriavidus necator N-1]|uniref:Uncharacterized protein n=1 Tax=Cupriavidus necator (strain ATCC 43291 / DSM 13513 / CCUG 52238 / LMG 8453 / N-1) TaxID=1042878 RepID=G0ERX5_CUPNN|nr:hypothetical protein CNE_1c00340 [Cupriavidus necator N-1]KAI3608584.1 hypothetical protein D8I24_1020 [Cupriavidus necator H850]